MKRPWMLLGAVILLGVGGLAMWFSLNRQSLSIQDSVTPNVASDTPTTQEGVRQPSSEVAPQPGRYVDYSPAARAEAGFSTTILFFHAAWCPECRGFERAIEGGIVPPGVQILKVDYDSAQELRQRYGVTIQSTFVRVSPEGDKQVLWTGYGKDKSIDVILENTK